MSRIDPLKFQERHITAIVARFQNLQGSYNQLTHPKELDKLRQQSAAVMLQAPTGIGKTLIATEVVAQFSALEDVVWFWFAPYATLIDQAAASLQRQAPQLKILSIEHQRTVDELASGALFVITWQTVATKTKESRLARTTGDAGLSVDDLIAQARALGLRVGVVVDEAHHGFVKAKEAYRFFAEVLEPDYALMMTATPRDADVSSFADKTGYQLGDPTDWASITRHEGYQAGLLKLGVKTAQFLTRNNDDAALVDFEEVAMSECAAMHREIKKVLAQNGVALTPLMLVQVPNGGVALQKARDYLTGTLKFPASAVKVHVSEEPDPNLQALAQDPTVEVLVFKMAIAMGFDAPRAFTLAALRGTRDTHFGIQVVGRIMRVHSLLQRRPGTPQLLDYGYVFLANRESQEGLMGAASVINKLKEHTASATPDTVITFTADSSFVQVVKFGQTAAIFPAPDPAAPTAAVVPDKADSDVVETSTQGPPTALVQQHTPTLFPELVKTELAHGANDGPTALVKAFKLDAQEQYDYPLRVQGLPLLVTEVLPTNPDDFEAQLVSFVDFTGVLADRDRGRTQLVRRTVDIFEATEPPDDKNFWARMSVAGIAQRARQIAFEYPDVDSRQFLQALRQRFRDALEAGGFDLPESDEGLTQQLELVLIRNPHLIRQAHKRCRASQISTQSHALPPVLLSKCPLEPAKRNVYGIFPADLSPEELRFAQMLDTCADVEWWHRNPVRQPESVALYRWSSGVGFFPDFLVAVKNRKVGDGVALVEFKGPHLQQYEKEKAGAVHMHYGRVFMVGVVAKEKKELRLLRLDAGELSDDGLFEALRLRYE
ncbi:MAG: DEAD/DEAH box helicase family protein [Rhodoferax sp.]|nr:DEAD/DEAH box helicase family protein [Rhodoferax sp.]